MENFKRLKTEVEKARHPCQKCLILCRSETPRCILGSRICQRLWSFEDRRACSELGHTVLGRKGQRLALTHLGLLCCVSGGRIRRDVALIDSSQSVLSCATRLSGTVVFGFPVCRGSPRREGHAQKPNQSAALPCRFRLFAEEPRGGSHRGCTVTQWLFTCGGSKRSRAGRGFETFVEAHAVFWHPQSFNCSIERKQWWKLKE